jgi:membrane-bound inhibitor of C-type lysozyme
MNKTYITIAAGIVVIIIGTLWYFSTPSTAGAPSTETAQKSTTPTSGSYQYDCDEHVSFTMAPSSDASSLVIAPVGNSTYPSTTTLARVATTSGALYTGGGIIFTARGETVTLGEGASAITCSPVTDQNNAPFNFGD